MDYNNDTWKVIDNYFKVHKNYLTKHHLDSFNDFVLNKIPLTIKQYNPQILYNGMNKDKIFEYETHIYYGGKDGSNVYIGKPVIYKDIEGSPVIKKALYPNEARLRNLTYASHLFCDVYIEYIILVNGEKKILTREFKKINLGQIPIMLHSKICMLHDTTFDLRKNMGECPYEQGGYFVVDGQEKVIVSHERKAENKLYIIKSLEGLYSYSAQIKSVPNDSFKYARTTVVNINKNTNVITVRLPSLKKQIPLFLLFRALGIENDKEILEYILYDLDDEKSVMFMEVLRESIEDIGPIYTQDMALKYLANITIGGSMAHLKDVIVNDVFPHVGDGYKDKAYYLGHVVHKLLNVLYKIDDVTDRDSFEYKRVDLSGFLLANLFRENFKQFQRDTKIAIDSEYRFNRSQYEDENYQNIINEDNIKKIFNQNVITNSFKKAFKIGTILNKKGLIQSLNRLSNLGTISHLRRINTYGDMIMIGQRKLHPTQYGIICPVETPDGGNIGIKKHLTITGHITFGCDSEPIITLLKQLGIIELSNIKPTIIYNNCKIFVNGKWIGIHKNPLQLLKILKLFRRNSYINIFTSIVFNYRSLELCILTDGGRCCRPLYIMEDNELLIGDKHITKMETTIDWYNLVGGFTEKKTDYYDCVYYPPKGLNMLDFDGIISSLTDTQSVIEFIDTDEMTQVMLCNDYNKEKTNTLSHCEIHPSLIMGILGFTIPYVNTSQAPRNVYGTGQSKQSVGVYTSNYRNRFDVSTHLLHYSQKPLVKTRLSKYGFVDKLPTGINAIVAISSYTGYNQEDSIIINKSSMERGLFVSSYFKTYDSKEEIDTRSSSQDLFYNPLKNDSVDKKNDYNYNNVDESGLVKEGMYVNDNDVLISKYTEVSNGSQVSMKDSSVAVKMDGYGVVDKVFSDYYNSDKQKIARVRICTYRNPSLGDKFASRHGQKGVIGMILPQEDMPFTKDGIVPDIIINPHAIPSRMTIGQLVECVMGKSCCLSGMYADATPFTNIDNNEIFNLLEKNNFSRHGDEILYSGINGKQMSTNIFIGPTYYQRLKHMVKDKINSRATGAISLKTKQPPSGRSVGGGLRIGEMERDAIISHGAVQFLKESMMERSDKYTTYISSNSGLTSIVNENKNRYICPSTDGPLRFDDNDEIYNNNSSCDIVKVNIPFNTHLMMQECNAMGISMRLIIDKESNYKKLDNVNESKFELSDIDVRKTLSTTDISKRKPIPKSKKNIEKFVKKMTDNKIMVSNLDSDINVKTLVSLFHTTSNIFDVRLNNETSSAIIIFTKPHHAKKAIDDYNGVLLDNKRIVITLYTTDIDENVVQSLDLNPRYGDPGFTDTSLDEDEDEVVTLDDESIGQQNDILLQTLLDSGMDLETAKVMILAKQKKEEFVVKSPTWVPSDASNIPSLPVGKSSTDYKAPYERNDGSNNSNNNSVDYSPPNNNSEEKYNFPVPLPVPEEYGGPSDISFIPPIKTNSNETNETWEERTHQGTTYWANKNTGEVSKTKPDSMNGGGEIKNIELKSGSMNGGGEIKNIELKSGSMNGGGDLNLTEITNNNDNLLDTIPLSGGNIDSLSPNNFTDTPLFETGTSLDSSIGGGMESVSLDSIGGGMESVSLDSIGGGMESVSLDSHPNDFSGGSSVEAPLIDISGINEIGGLTEVVL
jgi:DNA-directed RNA polymerase II subunit RPB2